MEGGKKRRQEKVEKGSQKIERSKEKKEGKEEWGVGEGKGKKEL